MKAMIFAAGYGTRLLPLTQETPKALVPVKSRPMLDWIINQLCFCGITDVIINTHHLHHKIESYLNNQGYSIPITISYEETILGTGGGLFKTKDFWNNESFLVYNSDILCNADLRHFITNHVQNKSLATLAVNNKVSSSMLLIDKKNILIGRHKNGKQTIYRPPEGGVKKVGFCGIHMISPEIFLHISQPVEFSIIDEYFRLIKNGFKISTWDIKDAYWRDVGTPETLNAANREFPGITYASS